MASTEQFQISFSKLKKAIYSFEALMNQTILELNDVLKDGVINGRIQKFEVTSELLWKTCKIFLEWKTGINEKSPKMVYKAMFKNKMTDEETTIRLNEMIDDRNFLSHEYADEYFIQVHAKLPLHLHIMKQILATLEKENK